MASETRHRILKQVLDIDVASPIAARAVQDALATPFRNGDLPTLERLFDLMAAPGTHIRVNRLEIDLGTVSGPGWLDTFLNRLQTEVGRALDSGAGRAERRQDVGISRHTTEDSDFDRLLFFLEHGRLPWWSARPPSAGWIETALTNVTAHQWQALLLLLQSKPHAQQRLIANSSESVLELAIQAWTGLTRTRQVLEAVTLSDAQTEAARRIRRAHWRLLIRHVVSGPIDGMALVRELLQVPLASPPSPAGPAAMDRAPYRRRAALDAAAESLPAPWHAWLRGVVEAGRADEEWHIRDPQQMTSSNEAPVDGSAPPGRDTATSQAPEREPHAIDQDLSVPVGGAVDRESGRIVSMQEWLDRQRERATRIDSPVVPALSDDAALEVYVSGAGIVILHPFLRELFESLGLLRDDYFADDAARHRAVRLLAYLTFGTEAWPEYELLLAKLLCNLPWEVPLEEAALSDDERRSCDELLAAVLGHWQALKGCSVSWMREQFFLREGKVERVDHGFKLTVERHAQDVLLTRLPWGLGVIRLPWQGAHLYLDWLE